MKKKLNNILRKISFKNEIDNLKTIIKTINSFINLIGIESNTETRMVLIEKCKPNYKSPESASQMVIFKELESATAKSIMRKTEAIIHYV